MPTPKDKSTTDTTPAEPTEVSPEKSVDTKAHDKTDVKSALERTTQDGKGADPIPPSNFESFATEDVERKSVGELASEILQGKHGKTRIEALTKLGEQGYDTLDLNNAVNRLVAGGRPSTLLRSDL